MINTVPTRRGAWPLVELAHYVAGFEGGKSFESEDGGGTFRVLKVSAVTGSLFRPEESKSVPAGYCPPASHLVKKGDLLFSRANTSTLVGAVAHVTEEHQNLLLPDKIWRFLWRVPIVVDPRFVWHLFRTPEIRVQISQRATGTSGSMKNISQEKLLAIKTALPPLPEQRRIADILDAAEALRAKRRVGLAQLDELTRAAFLDLFGDPVANPRAWESLTVCEIGTVVTGNTPSRAIPAYFGSAIEWVKSDNIDAETQRLSLATEGLSESGRMIARTVPPGSILVTCIAGSPASIGNCAIADREVAFNQQINAIIPHKGDAHFLCIQLVVGKRLVQAASTASMKGMVSKSKFEQIRLIFPPLALQQEFARRVIAIDRLKALHRQSMAELDALFASLQHRAFQGEL